MLFNMNGHEGVIRTRTDDDAVFTGVIECELFADTYRRFGIQTVRSPVVEVEATVTPFEKRSGLHA